MSNILCVTMGEIFDGILNVKNVSLAVLALFLLAFVVILPTMCCASSGVKLAKFGKRLATFSRIDGSNIHCFQLTCAKVLPSKARKKVVDYACTTKDVARENATQAMQRMVDKSGIVGFAIYLVIYALGVIVCTVWGVMLGVSQAEYAVYLATTLVVGAVLFVIVGYEMYFVYNKYCGLPADLMAKLSSKTQKPNPMPRECDSVFVGSPANKCESARPACSAKSCGNSHGVGVLNAVKDLLEIDRAGCLNAGDRAKLRELLFSIVENK